MCDGGSSSSSVRLFRSSLLAVKVYIQLLADVGHAALNAIGPLSHCLYRPLALPFVVPRCNGL